MHRFFSPQYGLAMAAMLAVSASGPSAENAAIQWHSDPAKAHQLARQQNRPLLLLVTMDGCFYCTKMKQSTYQDAVVASEVADRFVAARIDAKGHRALVEKLGVEVYPTTVIVSPDYRVLDVIRGYVDSSRLRQRMTAATRHDRITKSDVETRQNVSRN